MKLFHMEKTFKRAFWIAVVLWLIATIEVGYIFILVKEEWKYTVNIDNCEAGKGRIREIRNGSKQENGEVLKYITLEDGSKICIFRKEGEWKEYPVIKEKNLMNLQEGENLTTYIRDGENAIKGHNLVYDIEIKGKQYMPLEEVRKADKINNGINVLAVAMFAFFSIFMFGMIIFFYKNAETSDMYIKEEEDYEEIQERDRRRKILAFVFGEFMALWALYSIKDYFHLHFPLTQVFAYLQIIGITAWKLKKAETRLEREKIVLCALYITVLVTMMIFL